MLFIKKFHICKWTLVFYIDHSEHSPPIVVSVMLPQFSLCIICWWLCTEKLIVWSEPRTSFSLKSVRCIGSRVGIVHVANWCGSHSETLFQSSAFCLRVMRAPGKLIKCGGFRKSQEQVHDTDFWKSMGLQKLHSYVNTLKEGSTEEAFFERETKGIVWKIHTE